MAKSKTTTAKKESNILTFDQPNTEAAKGRVTAYEVKEGEEDFIHVELEKTKFNGETGLKQSRPFVQIYNPQAWNQSRPVLKNLGFKYIKVLHAPEGTNIDV